MNVLVDTSIWSLALRRTIKTDISYRNGILVTELKDLILEARAEIIGPIRQEILSGISQPAQFKRLKSHLSGFLDLNITMTDYEKAAEFYNLCRSKGIQGSHIDFLICAVAERYGLSIFTADKDFNFYSKHLPCVLHKPKPRN